MANSEKKYQFPEGLFTEKEWVQRYADRFEEAKVDWYSLLDRRKWNRMDGRAQVQYEEKLKQKAEKPEYRAWKGDTFQTVSKATYLWATQQKSRDPTQSTRLTPLHLVAIARAWGQPQFSNPEAVPYLKDLLDAGYLKNNSRHNVPWWALTKKGKTFLHSLQEMTPTERRTFDDETHGAFQ